LGSGQRVREILLFTDAIMGGVQDNRGTACLLFGNVGLRHDFATKGRFAPRGSIGIGAGATKIRAPDLSEEIQFAEQVGLESVTIVMRDFRPRSASVALTSATAATRSPKVE